MYPDRNECMANFTLIELHLDEGSFSTSLPFSDFGSGTDEETESEDDGAVADAEESGGPGKGKAAIGVLLLLVVGAALVRYLSSDESDTGVDIETADEDGPVGVTVDTDD